MTDLLLILLALTLALTATGSAALLIRRTRLGRSSHVMSAIWCAVLLSALIPLYLPVDLPSMPASTPVASPAEPVETPRPLEAVTETLALPPHDAITADTQPTTILTRRPNADALRYLPPLLVALWAIGVAVMLGRTLVQNRRLSVMLRACSSPCDDPALLAALSRLSMDAGLSAPPELRILDAAICLPPCTTGFFTPHIYLPAVLPTDADARAAILAHELCHIRRRDIYAKLLALAVLSLHWFNPLAHALLPRIYEDIEPACDRDTLALLGGEDARVGYMRTLLDVAATTRAPLASAVLFFVGQGHTRKTLERRFNAMKKTRHPNLTLLITAMLILALTLFSAASFTACADLSGLDIHAAANVGEGYADIAPLVDRIVRYHYDLASEDEITDDMLAGITSLKLSVDDIEQQIDAINDLLNQANDTEAVDLNADGISRIPPGLSDEQLINIDSFKALLEEKTLVSFEINTHDAAAGSKEAMHIDRGCLSVIPRNFFEHIILATIRRDGSSAADFDAKKVNAYYVCKDINDLTDERAKQELISAFPGIEEQAVYIQAPTMHVAETALLYSNLARYGVLDPQLLDSTIIDTDALYAAFPNLTAIELVGLTEK